MGRSKGRGRGRPATNMPAAPRKYLSGHEKQKRKREEEQKHAKIIGQMRRMTDFTVPHPASQGTAQDALSSEPSQSQCTTNEDEEMRSDSGSEPTSCHAAPSLQENPSSDSDDDIDLELPIPASENDDDSGEFNPLTSPTDDSIYNNDIGLWPYPITASMRRHWSQSGSHDCQHKDDNFIATARRFGYESYHRHCRKSFFERKLRNGEVQTRDWLCFSPSKNQLFCFVCKLFARPGAFCSAGYDDWKNGPVAISKHENSTAHCQAVLGMVNMRKEGVAIDTAMTQRIESLQHYWRTVLERIVAVIKFLPERGLAFRGNDEIVGSPYNGNFLGTIELLAEFDAVLAGHISTHANKGKGHTSYLSSTTCDEFIDILGEKLLAVIVDEVKQAKYFSISLDSTPDVSRQDQLVCILRYVMKEGPVERFVKFLHAQDHKAEHIANTMFEFLAAVEVDLADCRGQSYDNAANMAGKYRGVQQLVLNRNPHALITPCCNHSLNLVGRCAVSSCQDATAYFEFVQNLYKFFNASTHKHEMLVNTLKPLNLRVVKRLSDTRWSAHADAVKAIVQGYRPICNLLLCISVDPEDQSRAASLSKQMLLLETGILTELWYTVLEKIDRITKKLQSPKMHLNQSVDLLNALSTDLAAIKRQFGVFEERGIARSGDKIIQPDAYLAVEWMWTPAQISKEKCFCQSSRKSRQRLQAA